MLRNKISISKANEINKTTINKKIIPKPKELSCAKMIHSLNGSYCGIDLNIGKMVHTAHLVYWGLLLKLFQ